MIEITVKALSFSRPASISEVGIVLAKDFMTAIKIIHCDMEDTLVIEQMQRDLKRIGRAYYGAYKRRMIFQMREVSDGENGD